MSEAMFWRPAENGAVQCELCPHDCRISPGKLGFCGVRRNSGGNLFADAYGKVTAIALDPIEKKPLRRFCPGKMILSVGGYGCNFRCGFCQNHEIAMPCGKIPTQEITPSELATLATLATKAPDNIGVAYTYNEPLINYEFVRDCAKEIRAAGMKNVIVTNGFISPAPLQKLLPLTDAMNIDLKGFTAGFYEKIGGQLEAVKDTIREAHKRCHIEVTTLLIPGENDAEIAEIAKWLADISAEIPLHISRFYPRNAYASREATPREDILNAVATARAHLRHVYAGNM